MPPNTQQVLQDPKFRALPPAEQEKVLTRIDQNFAGLPSEERQKVLGRLKTPGASIQSMPTESPPEEEAATATPQDRLAAAGQAAARGTQLVGGSLAQGLAMFLGAPSDIAELAVNSLSAYGRARTGQPDVGFPDVDLPLGGEDFNTMLPDAMKPPKDMSTGERIVSRGIQEVGSAAAPIAASLKLLSHVNPRTLAMVETALAASGGMTAQTLKELFPGQGPLMEYVSEVLGSFGPTTALKMVRKAKDMVVTATGLRTEGELQRTIGEQMNKVADPDQVAKGIDNMKTIQKDITDYKPTTGQVSGSPGLLQSERGYQRSSTEATGKAKTTLQANQAAVNKFLAGEAPEGSLADTVAALETSRNQEFAMIDAGLVRAQTDVDLAKQNVSATTERVVRHADERAAKAEQAAQARVSALRGRLTRTEAGQILRQEYQKELAQYTAEVDRRFGQIDQRISIQPTNSRKAVEEVAANLRTQEADEFIPRGAMADLGGLGRIERTIQHSGPAGAPLAKIMTVVQDGPTTFGELFAAKKRLQGELRAAKNDTLKWRLNTLLDGVMNDLDQLTSNTALAKQHPEAAQAYQSAVSYAQQGIDRLKTGEITALRNKDKWGRFRAYDEDVAGAFLAGETPAEDFVKALGSRPQAREALRDFARGELYRVAVYPDMHPKAGQLNQAAAAKWAQNHDAALKQFPELKTDLGDAVKWQSLGDELRKEADAVAKNTDKVAQLKNPKVYGELNEVERRQSDLLDLKERTLGEWRKSVASEFLGLDADRAAQVIVRNPRPNTMVADVAKKIGSDPDGQAGFTKALWDAALDRFTVDILDAGGNRVLQSKKMLKFLAQNEPWMLERFGADRMQSMRTSAKAMATLESSGKPVLGGGSDTFSNMTSVLTNWGPFLSRLYAERSGRASMRWLISERTARVLGSVLKARTEEQAMELLDRAFYDPEVAHTWMLAAKNIDEKRLRQRFHLHLGTPYGAPLPDEDNP